MNFPQDKTFSQRVTGYKKKLLHEYSLWRTRRKDQLAERRFEDYLLQLIKKPPDVLLGANFASFGGVRGHICAIQKHSKLHVELALPDKVQEQVETYRLQGQFKERFWDFDASPIGAVHSHVYPWFIDWCHHQQQSHGIHWIHTYHLNYYPEHEGDGALKPWQQQINDALLHRAKYADVCLSVSKWQCHELREKHSIEAAYIPNGVDVSLCDRARPERFQRKQKLDSFVLYVGRDDPVKNPEEFVALAQRLPSVTCVMIGGGLTNEFVRKLCGSVPTNLKILDGMSQLQVQDAIAACSVLVVTSKREGLPTLVLEAMTHEIPLVVPDEAGCMEAIDGGQYGYIYRLGDLEDLERKVTSTLSQGRHDRGSRRRVLQEYDWRVVSSKLDGLYLDTKDKA